MKSVAVLLTFIGMLGMSGCAEEYEAEEFVGDEHANMLAENGEPQCVDDLCAVLDMYQDCVDEFPVTGDNEAQAALGAARRDAGGDCCDQGYYTSPKQRHFRPGTPDLHSHRLRCPIWMIKRHHRGSTRSERQAYRSVTPI